MMEPVRMDVLKDSRVESGNPSSAQEYERQTPRGNDNSCERCGGLVVVETICELMEIGSRSGIDTARCLNCGNFEDTIIRTNRSIHRVSRQPAPHMVGTRRQGAVQPHVGEQAIQTGGVISKYLHRPAPRLPIGRIPSAETGTRESSRIEPEHSP